MFYQTIAFSLILTNILSSTNSALKKVLFVEACLHDDVQHDGVKSNRCRLQTLQPAVAKIERPETICPESPSVDENRYKGKAKDVTQPDSLVKIQGDMAQVFIQILVKL